MSFSEKDSEQENNEEKLTNIEQNNSIDNNNNQTKIKKKNRTLQYYKFLFYSMKTEIKQHDFLKLLSNSNTTKLSIWTISVLLFINIPKNFSCFKRGRNFKIETY